MWRLTTLGSRWTEEQQVQATMGCGKSTCSNTRNPLPSVTEWNLSLLSRILEQTSTIRVGEAKTGGRESHSASRDGHTLVLQNGDRFSGKVAPTGIKSGAGVLTTATGDRIEGNWINDVLQGRAKIAYSGGQEFTGEFVDGKAQGTGKLVTKGGFK